MKRRWIIWVLIVVCIGAALWAAVAGVRFLSGRGPSTLSIQVNGHWQSVQVRSASCNLPSSLTFTPAAKVIRVEKLGYGPYLVAVHFNDGKTLWLECFHSDAGMAKTIDVVIQRSVPSDSAQVNTTCTYRRKSSSLSFSQAIEIDGTSEAAPTRIWGGP